MATQQGKKFQPYIGPVKTGVPGGPQAKPGESEVDQATVFGPQDEEIVVETPTPSADVYAPLKDMQQQIGITDPTPDDINDMITAAYGVNLPPEIQQLKSQLDQARAQMLQAGEAATGRTTEDQMGILEDSLRYMGGIGQQKLGTSSLFAQAGLTGYDTLAQSLNARMGEMDMTFNSFSNNFNTVLRDQRIQNQQLLNASENAMRGYQAVQDDYRFAVTRLDEIEARKINFENDLKMLDARIKAETDSAKTLAKYEFDLKAQGDSDWLDTLIFGSESSLPEVGVSTSSPFGNGVVTGYGSSAWDKGLDFQVKGGLGAPISTPFSGEVISVRTGFQPRDGKGFGNQVKIRTENGDELWISHLNDVNVKKGDVIDSGTVIGTQGNTGKVFGQTGVHLDLTMVNGKSGDFYSAKEVAELLGMGGAGFKPTEDLRASALKLKNAISASKPNEYTENLVKKLFANNPDEVDNIIDTYLKPPGSPAYEAQYKSDLAAFATAVNDKIPGFDLPEVYKALKEEYPTVNIIDDFKKMGVLKPDELWALDLSINLEDKIIGAIGEKNVQREGFLNTIKYEARDFWTYLLNPIESVNEAVNPDRTRFIKEINFDVPLRMRKRIGEDMWEEFGPNWPGYEARTKKIIEEMLNINL